MLGIDKRSGVPWCPCLSVAEELNNILPTETPQLPKTEDEEGIPPDQMPLIPTPKITCDTTVFFVVDGPWANCHSVATELIKVMPEVDTSAIGGGPMINCHFDYERNNSYLHASSGVACALNCLVGTMDSTFFNATGAVEECPACSTPADISSLAANDHDSGDHPHAHTHWWMVALIIILFLIIVVLIGWQVRARLQTNDKEKEEGAEKTVFVVG